MRGIYIFPSVLTLGNLASGVVSILLSANMHLTSAAWAIIAGIALDMVDGRVARWTGATSQFGVELDSLADLVTMGVAPAVLAYQLALHPLGRPGMGIAVFFAMTTALRLARFNVRAQTGGTGAYFMGLPSPAAAGIVASFVLSYELFGNETITARTIPILMQRMPFFFRLLPLMMMVVSFLMISSVHYGNFKQLKLGRAKSLQSLVFVLTGLLLIFLWPQNMIFLVFSLYVLSGLTALAGRFYHAQRAKRLARQMRRRSTDVGSDVHPSDI